MKFTNLIINYIINAGIPMFVIIPAYIFGQPIAPDNPYSNPKVNYIRSWSAKIPEQNATNIQNRLLKEVIQYTQYSDGLGRPLQTVLKQGSYPSGGNAVDMVQALTYDALGRVQYRYLPFASSASDGNLKLNPFQQQVSFYNTMLSGQSGETNIGTGNLNWAYGKTNYEPSPLNRVDNAYAPGASWVGSESAANEAGKHNIRIKYYSNTDIDDVRKWKVENGAEPGDWGTYTLVPGDEKYAAGELYKTITYDEHDKQLIEFTDKNGKLILKKVQLTGSEDPGTGQNYTGWMCTYYIYDDLGNLRCITPPAVTQQLASPAVNWNLMGTANLVERGAYCYEYDKRGRLIMRKNPGITRADAEYTVYDALNRVVLTQDGKQRRPSVNIWIAYLYDDIGRMVIRGFYTNTYNNKTFKQNLEDASRSTVYPFAITAQPSIAYWAILSEYGYDNYESLPSASGLTKEVDISYTTNEYLNTTYNASPLYAQQPLQSFQTRGKLTWSRIARYSSSSYDYYVNMYDADGRLIQQKSTNITNGKNTTTIQYNWAGQPLRVVEMCQFLDVQTSVVLTDILYDDLGRQVQVQKKIKNTLINSNVFPSEWTIVSKNEFDALGRVKKTELGKKKDPLTNNYTGEPIEYLNYSYSVSGQLSGINRTLLGGAMGTMPAMSTNGNYFGLDLGYDKATSAATGTSYSNSRFNGAISGLTWKTRGDQTGRQYDFLYDQADRFTTATFKQNATNTSDWNNNTVNFSETVGSYDYNGNIKTLTRKGLIVNNSPVIDDLTYSYWSYDNRPYKIADAAPSTVNMNLGDFQDGPTQDGDYNYNNGNGSLTTDFNKGLNGITYFRTAEYPKTIVTPKGTLTYTYADDGNKLRKVSVENASAANGNRTITITTTFINGYVYQSRDASPDDPEKPDYTSKLLFIAQEHGRIRALYNNAAAPNTLTGFAYDYFVKDHLSNTRMVLTEEVKTIYYPAATLEGTYNASGTSQTNSMINHEKKFYNIDNNKVVAEPWNATQESADPTKAYFNYNINASTNLNYPSGCTPNSSAASSKVYRLKGDEARTGLELVIKVMAGDKVDILGKSYHTNTTNITNANSTLLNLAALMTNLLLGPGNAAAAKGISAATLNTINTGLVPSAFFRGNNNEATTQVPKAYINYIFFDEQFTYAGGGFSRVGNANTVKDHWQTDAQLQNISVPKNGFLFVYVSNESNFNVFFDNLQVVHKPGPIQEEAHYYPYGMKMAAISSKAFSAVNNPYQYQGDYSDYDEETGWNDFYLRSYDAQTGLWTKTDPYSQFASPYIGMGNDPVNGVDEDGGWSSGLTGALIGAAALGTTGYLIAKNQKGVSNSEALGIGLGSALLGGGLGYGVGETWFGGTGNNFFLNMQGFYMGLFGSSRSEIWGGDRPGTGSFGNARSGTVPNIWGGLNLPSFEFGWEIVGSGHSEQLFNTIHLMGVNEYKRGQFLHKETSGDPDIEVYSANGSFPIPPVPEGGKNELVITDQGIGGDQTAILNGSILKINKISLNPKGETIRISASANTSYEQQRRAYLERRRQIDQSRTSFDFHGRIQPNLNFDVHQYRLRTYTRWRYNFLGIKTIGRRTY